MYSHMLQQRSKHFSTEHSHSSSQAQETVPAVPSKQRKNKAK